MKYIHAPRVDARYWTAITLASVFGTNMGDFYAHESGLGIVKGLLVLAVLTAIVFAIERFEDRRHEAYYWLVIIIIRTGATNIADYLAFRVRVPPAILTSLLVALLVLFGWGTHRALRSKDDAEHALPNTDAPYWLAMLTAGVFGTVAGDLCEKAFGEGIAAIALTGLLLVVLVPVHRRAAKAMALYWTVVAIARTAGTAVGDWFAENKILHIGLPLSTLMTGMAFVGVLVFWRSQAKVSQSLAGAAMDEI